MSTRLLSRTLGGMESYSGGYHSLFRESDVDDDLGSEEEAGGPMQKALHDYLAA